MTRLDSSKQQQNREPALSGILSFFFMGLGQAYNGQRKKAYMFIGSFPVFMIVYFILRMLFNEPMPAKGEEIDQLSPAYLTTTVMYLIVWIFGIYDAVRTARQINNSEVEPDSDDSPGRSALVFLRTVVLAFVGLIVLVPLLAIMAAMLFGRSR